MYYNEFDVSPFSSFHANSFYNDFLKGNVGNVIEIEEYFECPYCKTVYREVPEKNCRNCGNNQYDKKCLQLRT